ncbi:MAG TPA: FHA domain-containing protein [Caldimonas sp.]|nr:FHA domain-containing protein [Caldimonas sp.]HEV7575823.1 FHA domain-containing protein [Caldimonas sp.]
MSMKSWVLHRVQGIGGAAGRADLPARDSRHLREPDLDGDAARRASEASDAGAAGDPLRAGADLGAYAPLIGAVRDELEHFVASHVRLHVVIAERDRFVLTSIGVRSPGGAEARELLQQFMHEFRPEQVKRYLAREVIGRLPNAAVIDLSQFAGLSDLEAGERHGDDGEYRELLAALRPTPALPLARPYEVSVLGRWSEADAAGTTSGMPSRARRIDTPTTPLAGRRCEFDIVDGAGPRRAVLHAVVPGRRYVVGKDEGSDLRVDGTYTSRRHAEIWLDDDGWRVADGGSTNGVRVERVGADGAARVVAAAAASDAAPMRVGEGMRIVLSARAEGPPGDYPSIALRPMQAAAAAPSSTPATPIATAAGVPKTPLTAVLALRPAARFAITAAQASGTRVHALADDALPLTVGRSRDQTIVIDRRHQGVSGQHVAIDTVDESGAHGTVHGDNGIVVDGVARAAGERFDWQPDQTMVLGGSLPGEPACTLVLARSSED